MESHVDFESFSPTKSPSSPVPERKLKRLKKAKTLTENPPEFETLGSEKLDFRNSEEGKPTEISPKSKTLGSDEKLNIKNSEDSQLGTLGFEKSSGQDLEELDSGSRSGSEGFGDENGSDTGVGGLGVEEDGSSAKRTLNFNSLVEELDGRDKVRSDDMEIEKQKEDTKVEELEKKKRSSDGFKEKKDNKRAKSVNEDKKTKSAVVSKRRADKESREQLKQLQAESQRLLRETRDAAFKSVPQVRKPISSLLEKIRQRKLEVSKKSIKLNKTSFIDDEINDDDDDDYDDDGFAREVMVKVNFENSLAKEGEDDKTIKMASEEEVFSPAIVENSLGASHVDASNITANHYRYESVPTQMAVEEEPKQAFRAPIDDTQDLFSDSQTNGSKDEFSDETPSSPLEEVLAPSLLAMNLKFDSAPPDDDSSDEEDYDKENIDPGLHKLGDLSLSSNGDPVKAFVDDEAEEEDDSDNDLNRFLDEDDEDNEDAEELKDMIATGFEEKPVDIERRNELHQKWLEQQDAVGTENLLQRFKHGSKQTESSLLEDDAESQEDGDFDDEYAEDDVPTNNLRMNLKKMKEMIPQMFTDKDDAYISSDDEETEKTIVRQCLLDKSEEQGTFMSPAEDKGSSEVFSLIKKLNIVPDTRKKAKISALSGMRLIGGNGIVSSKSSFLGRGSNHSLPSSLKHGSSVVRSFIFEREDSNSRSSNSEKESSSDLVQRENRQAKTASTKLYHSQINYSTRNIKAAAETNAAYIKILVSSSSVPVQNEHEDVPYQEQPWTDNSPSESNFGQQDMLLHKLDELVIKLSEIVTRLESKLSESPKVVSSLDEKQSLETLRSADQVVIKEVKEDEVKVKAVSVTKYSPFWSERFQFVSAVKLESDPTCINILPFRDYEGYSKYVAVGDDKGRVFVFMRNGDVSVEFYTISESPIVAIVSYMSVYKNESVLITGHQDGEILIHRVYEKSNGDDWSSLIMENVRKFTKADNGEEGLAITILEVHHVGRMRYILSANVNGKITVFTENGMVHGSAIPTSKPLVFLKQRLLFLTESGAGSLDLRTMKFRESECEGLNHSLARNYVFDTTERSKAYGFTSEGDLIHVLLLGDVMNFKCRVRSMRKFDIDEPLALQAIKGYLLVVNEEKVFVYNVSTQHYMRSAGPRLLFSAGLDEIRASFLNYQMNVSVDMDSERRKVKPLIASDRDKLLVLGLGGGYVGMYRSKLPIFKVESNVMQWTSPVFFFILFLFGAWHFFAKKKEALTSWGPDDPFSSTSATSGAPIGSGSGDRSFVDSSTRSTDIMDLRSGGLRGSSRRYVSPSRYPGGATGSFRPSSADPTARPPVDPNYRAAPELKFRGSSLESTGFSKRRESLFVNNQVMDDNN
ncbi:hypothetical protein EZV62_021425 [Acer yangbiense]|uniref:Uncharacterized protein n=1 Tax=Acer yangbiense TaxID=1000413 RepID=A0A5C7H7U5_9ROSI|nr:hypothetical protein EZV62_021425 [Acer yangbiense]